MQIPVLIEPLPDGRGFRARAGEPFRIAVEAPDRERAVDEVRQQAASQVASGVVVLVEVPQSNPMLRMIGTLDMSDPRAQEWWSYLEAFRRECDNVTFPGEGPDPE